MSRVAFGCAVAAAFALAACASDGERTGDGGGAVIITTTTVAAPASPATTAAPTSPPATAPPASGDPITTTTAAPTTTAAATTTTTEPVVGDPVVAATSIGRFTDPVDLTFRPGADADAGVLYVVEQVGRVVRVAPDGSTTVVADLGDRLVSGGEQGLLGLAFYPDGGFAYVDYTDRNGDTVVSEIPVAADGTFDVASERVLITVDQPYGNHNGGDLEMTPTGLLYISLGDGGSGGDPERRASDPAQLLGSLLRIDPTPSADRPYTIPADNPFATGPLDGVAGAPEVWAWGLRNPWRITIDPVTRDLWIADVGQNLIEEVDVVHSVAGEDAGRGANFGWSAFEGTSRYNTDVPDPGNVTMPVLTYPHGDDGCSISGGAVYRGAAIAELAPAFVYSDYCSGRLWALDLAGSRNLTLLDGFENVTAVRHGPDGELYVLELGGTISKIVPG